MKKMSEDFSEKTSILGDTFTGRMRAADEAPPALVVLMGPNNYVGRQFSLTEPEYILGRAVECAINLLDPSISRNHARIQVMGSDVSITDMGSSNKTIINGVTINAGSPFRLKNNDQLKMGSFILKFLEKGNIEAFTNKELNEKATRDALTSAYTKGALLQRGPEAVQRAESLKEPLSIVMFDIDHFKKINDQFGHPTGDFVLKTLGQIVGTRLTRSEDFFARYGGEEFVLILPNTTFNFAMDVAERIRTTIQTTTFSFENRVIPVTISLGVACLLSGESDWESLLKRADEALYSSKQNGRNRVTGSGLAA